MLNVKFKRKKIIKKKNSREKKLRRNEPNYIVLFGTFGDRIYKITSIIYFYIGGRGRGGKASVFTPSSCSIIQHEHIHCAKKFK